MPLTQRWRVVPAAIAALAAGAILGAAAAPLAIAASPPQTVHVIVNGQAETLTPKPVVIDGVPYVPAPSLASALGLSSRWNAKTGTLEIGTAAPQGKSFVFQGVRYTVTGLQARTYPGPQSSSGLYWIVQYALTNVSSQAIDVPSTQPSLVLLGPRGAQYQPDSSLSGATAGTLNPGISFASYAVFNVPAGAAASAYGLGFDAYRASAKGFEPGALGAALPAAASATKTTDIGGTYTVSGLWNSDVQEILVRKLVVTSAILPDLTAPSFEPTTRFWIVDFSINNPAADSIALTSSDFALQFADGTAISPYPIASLPGYVADNDLFPVSSGSASTSSTANNAGASSLTVTVPAGQVYSGALLFEVPSTVATAQPQLSITVSGQQRLLSVAPCPGGVCPQVQD